MSVSVLQALHRRSFTVSDLASPATPTSTVVRKTTSFDVPRPSRVTPRLPRNSGSSAESNATVISWVSSAFKSSDDGNTRTHGHDVSNRAIRIGVVPRLRIEMEPTALPPGGNSPRLSRPGVNSIELADFTGGRRMRG